MPKRTEKRKPRKHRKNIPIKVKPGYRILIADGKGKIVVNAPKEMTISWESVLTSAPPVK